MKSIVHLTFAATLAATVAAQPQHHHQHQQLHKKHIASPVEKREPDAVTVYKVGPTVTLYELAGEHVAAEKAKEGIEDGLFVVVGESKPEYTPPPPPPPPPSTSEVPTPTPVMAAQFFESKELSTSTPLPETTPEPTPTTSSVAPPPTTTAVKVDKGSSSSGGQGINSKFDSGKVKCSHFPSDYGALAVDYLGTDGWIGVQKVPKYSVGDASISYIETAVNEGCTPGSFCSYACPVGYQKTQWPSAQGDTLQSIGGLYCNADGYLELSRPEYDTLCEKGAGGVWIQNDLDETSCVCRTDYPGTESMVIPTIPQPGEKVALTNPSANDYYVWNNLPTTAQYYVNKKGLPVEDACTWNSPVDPKGAGNWAPINIGTGKAADGNTYISIFPNLPTSTAQLDFNIEIIGDVNTKCALIDGQYTGGGSTGCTTTLAGTKGEAIIRFYKN
ncbi:Secreted beta-glucosidase sun1 like protein [Verticillium longisporum]|nr:Secreted beta-glucosidase sun1 like protein [Verticillium longisporum]